MNPENMPQENDRFADLLAAYDEALATGRTPDPEVLTGASSELAQRLHQARACLRRLEDDRLRALSPPDEKPSAAGESSLAFSPRGELRQMGRFQVVRELGRGGCGIVYLAFDPLLRREVALKVPRPDALGTPELRRRFLNEARAAAGLDHPNVVAVHEVGEAGPFCYLVATYCPGMSLADWLKQQPGPVPAETAAALVATLAEAVHYVHSRGILHRDLKPSNILLQRADKETKNGNPVSPVPKITDFGLAKWVAEHGSETKTGMVLGTPSYMAPEQALGQVRAIGPATDVYALGVILYKMLTGRTPFQDETDPNILKQVVSQEPLPPRRRRPELPRDLEAVCLKCLEKDPRRRYASAHELAEDLGQCLQGYRPRARRHIERAGRSLRRHMKAVMIAALVASTLLVATVTSYLRDPQRQLEGFQCDLERGKAVTLIDSTGPPWWSRPRAGGINLVMSQEADKPFTVVCNRVGLLELLPDPRRERYRFRADVRHDAFFEETSVGIYVAYSLDHTAQGDQHCFATLAFNDLLRKDKPCGRFELHRFKPTEPGDPGFHIRSGVGLAPVFIPPMILPAGQGLWRKLEVEVTPETMRFRFDGEERGPLDGPKLMHTVQSFLLDREQIPTDIQPSFAPRGALGLYVKKGAASFQHVVVEPFEE